MSMPRTGDADGLRGMLHGPVFTAADGADYHTARQVWNGAIDHHPAVVAGCANAADVAAAIGFARAADLEISVRGGAHNFGGAAVGEGGLTIDLSRLGEVHVDPAARTVRCGGGTTWAGLDAATAAHGMAAVGGTVSHTGVGGLTLGGGFGWLTPMHGLACDNLTGVELVTADGQLLWVSDDEHPELFWALRGGGGNFGVATAFEFRLHDVPPPVWLGLVFYDLEHGEQALTLARQVTEALPARTGALIAGVNAPPEPFVPAEHHFTPGYALILAGFGTEDAHARLINEICAALPPLFHAMLPVGYPDLQQVLDDAAPWGILAYEKSLYVPTLTPEVISVICEQVPRKSSPMSLMPMFPMTGAYTDVSDEDTAFGGSRRPGLICNFAAVTPDAEQLGIDTAWVREFWQALLPHATNPGGYVNFMTDYEFDSVRAAYGAWKYQRLAGVKRSWDPDNVFHRNPNIQPNPYGRTSATHSYGALS